MSLCSLIYNNTQGISTVNDLIRIMNIENQLYSSLSLLARQAYLLQSELPTSLNADPSSMQDACHMNFVIDLAHRGVSVAQW